MMEGKGKLVERERGEGGWRGEEMVLGWGKNEVEGELGSGRYCEDGGR